MLFAWLRSLPPRQARRRAHRSRHGCGFAGSAARKRFQCPKDTRNAARRTHGAYRRARSPHQPSGGSGGSRALRAVFRIPEPFSKSSIWRRLNPARARDRTRFQRAAPRPADMCGRFGNLAPSKATFTPLRAACAGRERVPVGTWAGSGPKRPAGVSKYKGCARPARRTPIFVRCWRQSRRPGVGGWRNPAEKAAAGGLFRRALCACLNKL